MKLWLLLALALTVQESVSVLALLYKAFQLHYSLWLISLVWLIVTLLQIWLGYLLGMYIRKKSSGSRFDRWIERNAQRLETRIHKSGEKFALAVFSNTISPALGAFLAAWLDLSFWNVLFYSFLGDLVWYISTLATVFGLEKFFTTNKASDLVVVGIVLILFLCLGFVKRKK